MGIYEKLCVTITSMKSSETSTEIHLKNMKKAKKYAIMKTQEKTKNLEATPPFRRLKMTKRNNTLIRNT